MLQMSKAKRFYMFIEEADFAELEELAKRRCTSKAAIIRKLVKRELRSCLKKSEVRK